LRFRRSESRDAIFDQDKEEMEVAVSFLIKEALSGAETVAVSVWDGER
jgi:hypothetical protein